MAENYGIDVRKRAIRAASKLTSDQRLELTKLLQEGATCLLIEEEYEKMVGILVEPVIVRYWIDCGHVDLKKPSQSNPFVSLYYIKG